MASKDEQGKGPQRVPVIHFPNRGHQTLVDMLLVSRTEVDAPVLDPDVPDVHDGPELAELFASADAHGRTRMLPRMGRGLGYPPPKTTPLPVTAQLDRPDDFLDVWDKLKLLVAQPDPTRVSSQLPQSELSALAVVGHRLFEMGRVDQARLVFERLLGAGAKDSFSHTMLGTIYLTQSDEDRALALFEAALGLDESDLAARVYRGEIRLKRGRLRLAVNDLIKAFRAGPSTDPFVVRARRLLVIARHLARADRR